MLSRNKGLIAIAAIMILGFSNLNAQDNDTSNNTHLLKKLNFYELRGPNVIDAAIGTSVINGDLMDPLFEIYFKIGYKHHLTNHLNIGVTYNKYNIAYKDVYNEGFMSFDFNIEYLTSPYRNFSPFIYAGYGYNAANYFESTATKVQGGIGFETIVTSKLGLRLFGEYNYSFTDELDGVIAGATDDTFWRIGLGVNIYFGGNKRKERLLADIGTIINSNLIK